VQLPCTDLLIVIVIRSDKVEKQLKTILMKQYNCTMADKKAKLAQEMEVRTILMLSSVKSFVQELQMKYHRGLQIERQQTESTDLLEVLLSTFTVKA